MLTFVSRAEAHPSAATKVSLIRQGFIYFAGLKHTNLPGQIVHYATKEVYTIGSCKAA